MTTEREYQEWRQKRPKISYKSRQNNSGFLWLLGLLMLSTLMTMKAYESTNNLPLPSSSSPISGEQI